MISGDLGIYFNEATTFDNFCQIVRGKMKSWCIEEARLN